MFPTPTDQKEIQVYLETVGNKQMVLFLIFQLPIDYYDQLPLCGIWVCNSQWSGLGSGIIAVVMLHIWTQSPLLTWANTGDEDHCTHSNSVWELQCLKVAVSFCNNECIFFTQSSPLLKTDDIKTSSMCGPSDVCAFPQCFTGTSQFAPSSQRTIRHCNIEALSGF